MTPPARGPCRIDDRRKLNNLQTIVLENERLRISVLADIGARIHEFVDKCTNRDWLYHSPGVPPRRPVFGSNYDDWWTGGIDEIAPTGWPCEVDGRSYPLHGELWSQPWHYHITKNTPQVVEVQLWCQAIIAPLRVERWMTLRQGEPTLHLLHRLVNLDDEPLALLWGLHPAFALEHEDYRIHIPSSSAVVDPGSPDYPGPEHARYHWPEFKGDDNKVRDMSQPAPPDSDSWCLHYALLDEGWMALTDLRAGKGIGMAFDSSVFKVVILWGVYGGWRQGVYCVSPEPWAGWPSNLSAAIQQGTALVMGERQTLETRSLLTLYEGRDKSTSDIGDAVANAGQ
jgi:galactose mutarotase-like enzyme